MAISRFGGNLGIALHCGLCIRFLVNVYGIMVKNNKKLDKITYYYILVLHKGGIVNNSYKIISKAPNIKIIVSKPFKRGKKYNSYYTMLFSLLEYGTNRLVIGDKFGGGIPVNKQMLMDYWEVSRPTMDKLISIFVNSGIIAKVYVYGSVSYYLNPKFAVFGDTINKIVYDWFDKVPDTVFNDKQINKIMNNIEGITVVEVDNG